MKKKMLAIVMAVAMTASLSSLAFAADESSKTGTVEITANIASTYTVTIPAAVTYTEESQALDAITASNVRIPGDKKVTVVITSDTDTTPTAGQLTLKGVDNSSDTFTVPLTIDSASYTLGTVAAAFTANDSTGKVLTLGEAKATHAGNYKATLTFTLDLVDTTT